MVIRGDFFVVVGSGRKWHDLQDYFVLVLPAGNVGKTIHLLFQGKLNIQVSGKSR